jgi:phosphoribosylpyrophosphate synthetase
MIEIAGADRYVTFDLHAGQIQGFFSIPGDVISAFHLLNAYVQKKLPQPSITQMSKKQSVNKSSSQSGPMSPGCISKSS